VVEVAAAEEYRQSQEMSESDAEVIEEAYERAEKAVGAADVED
jgi:hypothetical protein